MHYLGLIFLFCMIYGLQRIYCSWMHKHN